MSVRLAMLLALGSGVAAKNCKNLTVPVCISARNGVFDLEPPRTEIDVTNLLLNLSRQNGNYTETLARGFRTVRGEYELAATYCEPDGGPGDTAQILTHGISFDRSYWDFAYNGYNYSYVDRALDAGYATLAWDRLGIGHSSHGDPVAEMQMALEVAALRELTKRVRDGRLGGVERRFGRTVHVGHSFGSIMTLDLASAHPDATDAIVLTGFSQVPLFMAEFALGGNFAPVSEVAPLAGRYADGYVAPKTSVGVHINFFAPGAFDPGMLAAAVVTGQPAAVGELLTLGSGGAKSEFRGPVLIITGGKSRQNPLRVQLLTRTERDVPFCGGDCRNTASINGSAANLLDMSAKSFAKASVFNMTIVPGAGHGLNYEYSAGFTYKAILDFIKANV